MLNKKTWIKGALAENLYEQSVSPDSSKAVTFCSMGAIEHVNKRRRMKAMELAFAELAKAILRKFPGEFHYYDRYVDTWEGLLQEYQDLIANFNDDEDTKLRDVKKVFTAAIRSLDAKVKRREKALNKKTKHYEYVKSIPKVKDRLLVHVGT